MLGPTRPISRRPLTAAVAALALCAPPAHAAQQRLEPLRPPAFASSRAFPVRDTVRGSALSPRAAATIRAHAAGARFTTRDGISIPVEVSPAYKPDPAVEQSYVTLLGNLVHGQELRSLHVFIATPKQIQGAFCGAGALACYEGDNETMYVPGVAEKSNPPVQFLIAHEYGHHIERSRSNAPWAAFATGAKAWFTYAQVCTKMRAGKLGTGYWNDPSEGFAESYADMNFPGIGFPFSRLMFPDQGSYQAIRADVLLPWTSPHVLPFAGTFAPGARAPQSFQVSTPFDGTASFTLVPPARADYRLQVLAAGKPIAKGGRGTTTIRQLCGARTVTLQVTRVSGSGPFTLTASVP